MEASCLRQTELPHTSRLFSDFLYHFDRVEKFYRNGHARAGYPETRRAEMAAALGELNGPGKSLDLFAQPGTVAVVTGQQVGLFSGPSYTIYKALTAAKMARTLTEQGTPAVPIFWLATEDHDFAEVNHAWLFDATASARRIEVESPAAADSPVGGIRVTDWHVEELRQSIAPFAFGEEVANLVADAYAPGRTMGEAFHALLRGLLEPYGLLFIDPLQPAVRKIAAPMLREAIDAAPELSAALIERNKELAAAGYHAQVHIEPQTSLFFVLDGDRRVHMKRQNGDFVGKDRRYSLAELAATAEHVSPNAVLRPVLQDYLLPTTAYVGGPAELAYFAQSQVLYGKLKVGMPQLVSRSGFTLIDPRCAKLMDRYGLTVPSLFHGEDHLKEQIALKLVPQALEARFASTRAAVSQMLEELQSSVGEFDPTLGAAAARSRAKMQYQLDKLERKVSRESLRRDERAGTDAAYVSAMLFPHKHLQERFYSIVPFLARHGTGLIDQVYEHVNLGCPDHILLRLSA